MKHIARVTVMWAGPKGPGYGSAFPIAYAGDVAADGTRALWFVTAKHVVHPPEGAFGEVSSVVLDFPRSHIDGTFAVAVADRFPAQRGDWLLMKARLPATLDPYPWSVADVALDRKLAGDLGGYPTGTSNEIAYAAGKLIVEQVFQGSDHLCFQATEGAHNVDPKGWSGGPVLVGEGVVVGMVVASMSRKGSIFGDAAAGGNLLALPISAIIAEAGDVLPYRPPTFLARGPLSDAGRVAIARQLDRKTASELRALDAATLQVAQARAKLSTYRALEGLPESFAFLRAIQRLSELNGADIERFVRDVSAQRDNPAESPRPLLPSAIAINITWTDRDRGALNIQLLELHGGEALLYGATETLALDATKRGQVDWTELRLKCEAVSHPWFRAADAGVPVQFWVPEELVNQPFETLKIPKKPFPLELGRQTVVVVRVRWSAASLDLFREYGSTVPASVRTQREQKLTSLSLPLKGSGYVFDAAGASSIDPTDWFSKLSIGDAMVVARAGPFDLGESAFGVDKIALLAGVPVVIAARELTCDVEAQCLTPSVDGYALRDHVRAHRAGGKAAIAVIWESPDDPPLDVHIFNDSP